jgi:hypothetical protein
MKKFLTTLLHPLLLSFWGTIMVLLVFPLKINRYLCPVIDRGTYGSMYVRRYCDLDGDGNSEILATFHNSLGNAGFTVSNHSGVLNQWNFRGNYRFTQQTGVLLTGDCDGDHILEIYLFTLSSDSIFLQIIPDYRRPSLLKRDIFVTHVGKRKGEIDPFIIEGKMDDLTGDGFGELVFAIGTGYSLQPRRVYAYDAVRDTFLMSPVSGYFIYGMVQEDILGDDAKEIIPYGYAACNVYDTILPYPDSLCWMMVLDKHLQFAFPPVPFPDQYSELKPYAIDRTSGNQGLGALYIPPGNKGAPSLLCRFDSLGRKRSEQIMGGAISEILVLKDKPDLIRFIMNYRNVSLDLYDASFSLVRSVPFRENCDLTLLDADLDGESEIIATDFLKKKVTVFRNDLKHPVAQAIEGDDRFGVILSVARKKGKPSSLFVQFGNSFQMLGYGFNRAYPLRFAKYGGIYSIILLFTFLVRKIQRDQIRQKQETEKKITDLQLRIVRNQLDPHFTMNAVNSMIASLSSSDKEIARKQLMHFSALHRSLLLDSDRIRRSLEEEIRFTVNYLSLEKFRFGDRFDYHIEIDPSVDSNIQIPKMMLQIYSENSLKHGILPLQKKGYLSIVVSGKDPLTVEIRDNGVGRYASAMTVENHTGTGMAAMEQYFSLFSKLGLGEIKATVTDLFDSQKQPSGTLISITIHNCHA